MQVKLALSEGDDRIVSDLDEKELYEIGRVTVHWAYLEHLIFKESIALVTNAEIKTPADVTSHSFKKRIGVWRSLVDRFVENGQNKERLIKTIDNICEIDKSRRRIMHFLFECSDDGFAGPDTGASHDFLEIFDFEEMMLLANQIGRINFELRYPGGRTQAMKR